MHLQLPKSLEFLFTPARYKVAYGGRGGAKSWAFARTLLFLAWRNPLRILCARELQGSIKESVHHLLAAQVNALGLESFYQVLNAEIRGSNGSSFGFAGLRHNINEIKSYEGADICWVEEAQNVTHNSWEILVPTIRKDGSEIWVTFNPQLESDATYQRFVLKPPKNALVHKVNWRDNPWFNQVLRDEKDDLELRDPDAYLNVWEGNCRVTLEGAIYANELRECTAAGRICRVPYDERVPVHTYWDLGHSDCTSIWFVQKVGFEYHIIDFYQNRLQRLPHYLKVLQSRPYVYAVDHLPHDAEHESLAADSIDAQMKAAGRKTQIVRRVEKIQLGINATRTVFNRLWFDQEKCADGLQALRHYAYKVDEHGQWSKDPNHDGNSHAADALRTLGESVGLPDRSKQSDTVEFVQYSSGQESLGWLGT